RFCRASTNERAGRGREQSNTARTKEKIRRGKGKMDRGTPQRPLVLSNYSTLYNRGNTFLHDIRN
ncbi:hypothetical protein A2U01_0073808, partial [Trifolium medium]|nr:hypothetical protein [Trifolium medium]